MKIKWIGEKDIDKKTEVIILMHNGPSYIPDSINFDIFIRKDIKDKKPRLYKWLKEFSEDYQVECPYKKEFLKRHRNFEYIYSNDLLHIFTINAIHINNLLEIAKKFNTEMIIAENGE